MAARGPHVQPPEPHLAERRLRPIYDLLDCGSNKKALQEVEKVLKKWPQLQCARALKSLATLRMGREKDALALLEALAADFPTDDSTLLVMTIVYRETHQLDKVCRMYEAAVKKDPTSEELYTHLFMAHVRVSDLERQHHTAMALYRLKSKNPYYFWGVMSVVLQATKGVGSTDAIKRNVFLALAQRMVDKFINENKLEAEQEVQLYMMILQLQSKHAEALEFLESPLGRKLMPGSLPQASLPFLVNLEKWDRLNIQCKELIWDNADRWDFYLLYFQSAFKLMEISDESNIPKNEPNVNKCSVRNGMLEHADDTSEKCHEFLSQIIENASEKNQVLRGPYLARLELYKRLHQEKRNPEDLMGNASDLLVEYFRVFGHKACSVSDLRPYLQLVDENKLEQLAQRFTDTVGISSVCLPQDDEQMQRHICSLQLGRICGRQAILAEEHAKMLASTLALHCERVRSISPPQSSTERAPYDPYCLLAAHVCYDLALKCQSSKPLMEALYLLEYILQNSPSNFHIKLLCIKFYHMLGCGAGAHSIYESLDVKHMQVDSLGYIHISVLGSTGLYWITSTVYETTHKFYTHTYKDSVDYVTFAYKYGSFMKLEELMEFRERLHGSYVRAYVLVERAILGLVTSTSHTTAMRSLSQTALNSPENVINWETLRDNRDLGVFTNWDPLTLADPDAPAKQFEQEKNYVKLKYTLLECLISCSNISGWAAEKTAFDLKQEITNLETSVKNFDELFRRFSDQKYSHVHQISVSSPLPSRILNYVNSPMPFRELYCRAFSIVILYAKSDFDPLHKLVEECGSLVDKCLQYVCDVLDKQIDAEDPLWSCKKTLEVVVNSIEIVTVVSAAVGVCHDLTRQTTTKKGKKKNSAVASPAENSSSEPISMLLDRLLHFIDELSKKLNAWCLPNVAKDLSDYFSNLTVVIGDTSVVTNKLKDSHESSLNILKQNLKDKQKYLTGMA